MNWIGILKKNKLLLLVGIAYLAMLLISPEKAGQSVRNSVYYLLEMLQVLPVIFLLTVVIEALVPKEWIMHGFGEKSGIKGNLLALLLGSISAGPIYAAFPISKTLLGKGAGISNIVIILSSWAVVKLPMLANEAKFLGVEFMAIRWVLTVAAIFAMAWFMGKFVRKKDLPEDAEQDAPVEIAEALCIGCGLCAKLQPEVFEMKGSKAVVRKTPSEDEWEAVMESVRRCPSKAIQPAKEEVAS